MYLKPVIQDEAPFHLSGALFLLNSQTSFRTRHSGSFLTNFEKRINSLYVESLKMHPISSRRSFGALIALIVSALLLLTWNNESTRRLAKRQPLVENSLLLNSSSATDVSHLLRRHDIPLKHSRFHTSHIIQKRVGTLDYKVTVCKGQKLNGLISDVLEGRRTPSRDYGPDDIRNGWSREGLPRGIPDTFDVPFKAIGKTLPDVGERLPELSETHVVDLVQDMPFRNSAGKKQKVRRHRMLLLQRERLLMSSAHSPYLKRTT